MIQFSWYNVVKPDFFDDQLSNWIKNCVSELFEHIELVHYIFCDDNYILTLNQEQLDHDYFTDILTFDFRDSFSDALECEIYISIDTVRDNAMLYSQDYQTEFMRVMVHGLLHLTGLNDHTEIEKQHMRLEEDKLINHYNRSTWNTSNDN